MLRVRTVRMYVPTVHDTHFLVLSPGIFASFLQQNRYKIYSFLVSFTLSLFLFLPYCERCTWKIPLFLFVSPDEYSFDHPLALSSQIIASESTLHIFFPLSLAFATSVCQCKIRCTYNSFLIICTSFSLLLIIGSHNLSIDVILVLLSNIAIQNPISLSQEGYFLPVTPS